MAVNNVAEKNHKKKIQIAAYAQKDANAGKAGDAEMAKATKSVSDVTVMDAPARASADLLRMAKAALFSDLRETFTDDMGNVINVSCAAILNGIHGPLVSHLITTYSTFSIKGIDNDKRIIHANSEQNGFQITPRFILL